MLKKKENDSDDNIYDMLEIYEQCEYILWIVNEKKKKQTSKAKNKNAETHTCHTKLQTKIIVIWTIRNKMNKIK